MSAAAPAQAGVTDGTLEQRCSTQQQLSTPARLKADHMLAVGDPQRFGSFVELAALHEACV